MSERDGLHDEMRRLLLGELGSDPLAIDQDTADRLLAGRLDPADAPPGYAEVARVLEAAAAPPTPYELRGKATAMAAFVAARLDPLGAVSHAAPRRSRVGSKLVVAAVAAGVLMVGGVAAAATGALPEPAQRVVDSVSRTAHHVTPWSPPRHGDGGKARSSGQDQRPAVSGGHDSGQLGQGRQTVGAVSTGPGATGQAKRDACDASPAGKGGARGKDRSAAPQAANPAGAGKVDDSCKQEALPGRHVSAPESGLRPPANGKPPAGKRPSGRGPEGEGRVVPPRG